MDLNSKYLIGLVAIMMMGLNACKTKKGLTKNKDKKEINKYPVILNWDNYTSKSNVSFKGNGMDESATMYLKMKQDSIIWISVRKFGFEIVRIKALNDSVHILNKFKKEYMVYPVTYLAKQIGLDLNLKQLQCIFIANPILEKDKYSKPNTINNTIETEGYHLKLTDKMKYENTYSTLINRILNIAGSTNNASINYKNFKTIDSKNTPFFIHIDAKVGSETAVLKIQIDNVNFDAISSYPFKVSKSYVRKN